MNQHPRIVRKSAPELDDGYEYNLALFDYSMSLSRSKGDCLYAAFADGDTAEGRAKEVRVNGLKEVSVVVDFGVDRFPIVNVFGR